jgi:hypothetical protein
LTLSAAARLAPYVPIAGSSDARSGWTSWRADPDQWLQPLVAALDRSHVKHVYAGYWVAYALTFESGGKVVATDPGVDRYPPYLAAIERSDRQAWVFPRPSALPALDAAVGAHPWLPSVSLAQLERDLKRHGLAYQTVNAGYFTIVWTAHAVGLPPVVGGA